MNSNHTRHDDDLVIIIVINDDDVCDIYTHHDPAAGTVNSFFFSDRLAFFFDSRAIGFRSHSLSLARIAKMHYLPNYS